MVRVKICGITNMNDAIFAAEHGADALGFVFYRKSPRHIEPDLARKIVEKLPPFIQTVGVFVNESPQRINLILNHTGIKVAQLHGNEAASQLRLIKYQIIKAIRIKDASDINLLKKYSPSAFLLDSYTKNYGGAGISFDWTIAIRAKRFGRIILSGGLTPKNVVWAIRIVKPYGVDVSSGVELRPGKKDKKKVLAFIKAAKNAYPGGQAMNLPASRCRWT